VGAEAVGPPNFMVGAGFAPQVFALVVAVDVVPNSRDAVDAAVLAAAGLDTEPKENVGLDKAAVVTTGLLETGVEEAVVVDAVTPKEYTVLSFVVTFVVAVEDVPVVVAVVDEGIPSFWPRPKLALPKEKLAVVAVDVVGGALLADVTATLLVVLSLDSTCVLLKANAKPPPDADFVVGVTFAPMDASPKENPPFEAEVVVVTVVVVVAAATVLSVLLAGGELALTFSSFLSSSFWSPKLKVTFLVDTSCCSFTGSATVVLLDSLSPSRMGLIAAVVDVGTAVVVAASSFSSSIASRNACPRSRPRSSSSSYLSTLVIFGTSA